MEVLGLGEEDQFIEQTNGLNSNNATSNTLSTSRTLSANRTRKLSVATPRLASNGASGSSGFKTFYDSTVNGTGDAPFTAIQAKDLPAGAEIVPAAALANSSTTTAQATITGNGTLTWDNLPAVDESGNLIYYYVVEKDATANANEMSVRYSYAYNPDGSIRKVTITNTTVQLTGSLTVKKVVNGDDAKGTYSIAVKDASGIYYDLNGTANGSTPLYVTFSKGDSKTWNNLPAGSYTVEEANADAEGYTWSVSGTGEVNVQAGGSASTTVTNTYTPKPGALVITKKVQFNGADANTDAQKALLNKSFTFVVKASSGTVVSGSPFTITVENGLSKTITIPNLPEGDYTIEETDSNGLTLTGATGGKSVSDKVVTVHVTKGKNTETTVESTAKAEFTNNLPTTSTTVNKTWLVGTTDYSDKLTEMFGDVTVEVGVVKLATTNATPEAIAAANVVKDVFGDDAKATMTASGWTATVANLPVPEAGNGYYWKEISVKDGKGNDITADFDTTMNLNASPLTINNAPKLTEVTVEKVWATTTTQNLSATLSLYKGVDAASANTKVTDITLNGTEGQAVNIDNSDAKAGQKQATAWTATFSNLPKYGYDATNGVYEIAYVVKEDTVPDGYAVSYSGDKAYALTNEKVTNTEQIPMSGTKEWAELPENDQTTKSATLRLARYKGQTLDTTFGTDGYLTGVLDGTVDGTTTGELTAWTYTWLNQDKSYWDETANQYVDYTYKVVETEFTYGDKTYTVTEDNGVYTLTLNGGTSTAWVTTQKDDYTIINTKNDTWIKVKKVWKENDVEVTAPSDGTRTIEVTLYRTNGGQTEIGTYQLTTDKTKENELGYIYSDTYEWTISGLDKYYLNEGELTQYQYSIVETQPSGWTIAHYTDGVTTDETDESKLKEFSSGLDAKVYPEDEITVTNSRWSVSLPATGGPGTGIFYGAGASLMLLAVLGIVLQSRRRERGEGI